MVPLLDAEKHEDEDQCDSDHDLRLFGRVPDNIVLIG
jgi:hypothetical protein